MSWATPSGDCPDCGQGAYTDTPQTHYDHVHMVNALPRARPTERGVIVHGYAVGFAGHTGLAQTWIFFEGLEPAIAFGRAARMSVYDINSYGVCEAARETRFDTRLRRNVHTLHLTENSDLRDHDTERPILERWVRGCHPDSARFRPH